MTCLYIATFNNNAPHDYAQTFLVPIFIILRFKATSKGTENDSNDGWKTLGTFSI